MLTLAISSTPLVSSRSYSEDLRGHGGVPKRLTKVLGVCYLSQPSLLKMKNKEKINIRSAILRLDVSVNIDICMLFNTIVSDIFHSVVVCVNFLDTHMVSLVFFGKLGVTEYMSFGQNKGIDLTEKMTKSIIYVDAL